MKFMGSEKKALGAGVMKKMTMGNLLSMPMDEENMEAEMNSEMKKMKTEMKKDMKKKMKKRMKSRMPVEMNEGEMNPMKRRMEIMEEVENDAEEEESMGGGM